MPSVGGVPRDARSSPSDGPARRPEPLRRPAQFRAVYDSGRRVRLASGTLFLLANGLDHFRLGITVTRKVGNAVRRNRLKRRVREVFRRNAPLIPTGWDIVINPNALLADTPFPKLEQEVLAAVRKGARPTRNPGAPAGPDRQPRTPENTR